MDGNHLQLCIPLELIYMVAVLMLRHKLASFMNILINMKLYTMYDLEAAYVNLDRFSKLSIMLFKHIPPHIRPGGRNMVVCSVELAPITAYTAYIKIYTNLPVALL